MRKLASLQIIHNITPIENADAIETVHILGWKCVAKKGEFNVGDLCVYHEIDSVLDQNNPAYEFMAKSKFRVKTIRLRGQISQGLALPLGAFEQDLSSFSEGDDVTELLNITKYDPPEVRQSNGPNHMKPKGNFPNHLVPKTDEDRIQAYPKLLKECLGMKLVATVKQDGTSFTFVSKDGEIEVCSRNLSLKKPEEDEKGENKYWEIAERYDMPNKFGDMNIAIQGELCGPGIQKNRLGLAQTELYVFNIFDVDNWRYYGHDEMIAFCQEYGLIHVPIEGVVDFDESTTIDSLLEMAKGKYGSGHPREGLVFRPLEETYSKVLKGRLSFKVINNDFLLKVK